MHVRDVVVYQRVLIQSTSPHMETGIMAAQIVRALREAFRKFQSLRWKDAGSVRNARSRNRREEDEIVSYKIKNDRGIITISIFLL